MRMRVGILLTFVVVAAHMGMGQEITVAAAADLQYAFQEVTASFQKQTDSRVKVVYGSSGNLFEQIQSGAPFDMFFSANLDYPRELESARLATSESFYIYARGRIVLWAASGSNLDLSRGLAVLTDPQVKKIAIANPQHAPYGQAALAAMRKEGVYDAVKDKLVLGENISQAASFVTAGAAEVGIVALSLAVAPNMNSKGRYVEVASNDYPPLEQGCVILSASKNNPVARQFLAYIKTSAVANILHRYGFDVSQR